MRPPDPAALEYLLGGRADGVHAGNFARLPFVVFNRKDGLPAVCMGWGIGMLPLVQAHAALACGELVALQPQVGLAVALYWHRWRLGTDSPGSGAQVLDRIGAALADGAPC